ncbi:MAG: zinc metallopeptidase [Eubacteriales bacterium]|nr:zinc metallopeptidase [Eubacteriales bacterium]
MPFFYYYDPTYVLVLIAFALSMFASFGVNATFSKYKKVRSSRGITGAEAARKILDGNGLYNVKVEHISGNLNDHFDPKANVIRLSDATYSDSSVAAIGVAAHEAGHAVQYATNYAPIKIRNSIVPAVNISTSLSMPLFLIGLLLNMAGLTLIGIILFSASLLFQLITLPVEFNASGRAIRILDTSGMLEGSELTGAKKVLRAAGLTYVAAVAASALQLLRLLLIANRRRD